MRMNPDLLLVLLIVIGLIGRSPIIATAASLLLILKLTHLERFFPAVERRGLEIGLLFLTIAVWSPLPPAASPSKRFLECSPPYPES